MSYTQRHYPPGSGGCTRGVQVGADGKFQVKGTKGDWKTMNDVIQDAINKAIANNSDKAIYEFNNSKYYIDMKEVNKNSAPNDGDDHKNKSESDEDMSDVEDLLNDPQPGLAFVGHGAAQKIDIPFNSQQSILSLKESFADKMQCDSKDIQMLGFVNGEFVEIENQTLADNKINDPKDFIVFTKDDRTEAVKKMIRAKKWEDKKFVKKAKNWLKETGNEGKKGIDNLIKKNGLSPGWNDILSKLDYKNVLKIIKDDTIMSRIDKIRIDGNERKKYKISDSDVVELTYQQISRMHQKTTALREKFYEDLSKAALKGTTMKLNTDCTKYFEQFKPGEKGTNGKTIGFFGIISLIDGKHLKAMGIPCKNVDSIKRGQVYVYPSQPHNKDIKLGDKTEKGSYVNPWDFSGTGHSQLCVKSGLPSEYCAGFAITPPTLKFRSGTCNSAKSGVIKGFDNEKALNKKLQDCLKTAFEGTKATEFYSNIDYGNR